MALQKQVLSVSLEKGVDTKTDALSVMAGRFIVLENAVFTNPKSLRLRNGYQGLSSSVGIPQTASITQGQALATYQNELIACDQTSLYSYDVSGSSWISKGPLVSCNVTQAPVVRNTYQQTGQDSAIHASGLQCFAWEDTQGGSRYSVVDSSTGQVIVPSTLILATAIKPKVVAIGNSLVVLYVNTADSRIYAAPVSIASPTAALVPVAMTTNAGNNQLNATSPNYDATVVVTTSGPQLYVAYNNSTPTTGGISLLYSTAAGPTTVAGPIAVAVEPGTVLTVFGDLSQKGPVVGWWNGTAVKFKAFDASLAVNTLATPVNATFTTGAGTLATATYFYRVSALNAQGETLASAQTSLAITGPAGVNVNWGAVPGATQYKVYGRSTGAELLMATVAAPTVTFLDNGSITPSGALPSANTTTGFATGTVETIANVVSLTGVSTSATALSLRFFYSTSAAATYNYLTRQNTITGAYVVGTAAQFIRSLAIAGKALLYGATAYVPCVFQSLNQPTYFLLDHNSNAVAKILDGLAGPIPARASLGSAILPESNALAGGSSWQFALLAKDLLTTQSGQFYTQTGVESVTVNFFDPANSYLRAEIGQNLHFGGGFLQMYDGGGSPVEHGFHLYPEPVTVANPGGAFVYQYVVCYEWQDNQGQTHRSAPSAAITQAQAAAISGGATCTVTIPTLRITAKQNTRSPVTCVVYRTQNLGTTFYQTSSITSPTTNSTTADTVTFVDSTTDAALIGNPVLYTTGNVLPNIEPNASSAVAVHKNRMWALDSTNPLQWWFSKELIPPSTGANIPPVEFSEFLTVSVDPKGGPCTAGASLDDTFIIFKATSIFATFGDGPDSTGGGSSFANPQLITTDCGCVNPRSIVLTPNGLMFQSKKGIYLLSRGRQVGYIGADVEAYNSATVTSAQLISSTNQVRFTLSSGVALVYDYLMNQWSVFTNVNAVDSAIWQNLFTYLSPAGTSFQETPGVYADNGDAIKMRAVTSWFQFAGVQGFQRVYKALMLGTYASPHQLLVQIAYDFNGSATQQDYITPTTTTAYGGDATYGSGSPYGGTYPLYQWRVNMQQQKCEAIQLSIESVSTGTAGEMMQLSALSFEVGLKSGTMRLPATSTVG